MTPREIMDCYRDNMADAHAAYALFVSHYCNGVAPPRVPGMDTAIRLAVRIAMGRTLEQAAAREYLYRWHLDLDTLAMRTKRDWLGSPTANGGFAPHQLGLDGI